MTSAQFKAHREKRGLTQKQWADTLGVSYSSVTKMETGGKVPRYIEKLVNSLELGTFRIKGLTQVQERRLAEKAHEAGSIDDYVSDLLKKILSFALFAGVLWTYFQ